MSNAQEWVPGRVLAGLLAVATIIFALGLGTSAQAQERELSDRSVKVLMEYAWSLLPTKFTAPNGKVIEVDKSDRDGNTVPVDVARGVINVARTSAHAQICNLADAQAVNYQTMMRSEARKKEWSDQQMLYISQLHLFTVMWLTGNVQLVEKDGDKEVVIEDSGAAAQQTCTEEERAAVEEVIRKYICEVDPGRVQNGCTS